MKILRVLPALAVVLLAGALAAPAPAASQAPPADVSAAGRQAVPTPPSDAGTSSSAETESPAERLADPAFLARAKAYTRGNYLLYLLDTAWGALVLGWLAFSGVSHRAWTWLRRHAGEGSRSSLLYLAGFVIFVSITSLPIDYYDGFVREHAYGFSTQTQAAWFFDRIKGVGVSVVALAIFVLPLYGVIKRFPRAWWRIGAVLGCLFATFVVVISPVVVDPLFNRFTPLGDIPLRDEILKMAHENGIPAHEVFEMDASSRSVHDNAYVTGLFGTQRIVLYDTLLDNYKPDEIEFIMGHEMGHYVLHHIWKGLALSFLLITVVFYAVYRLLNSLIARYGKRTGFTGASDLSTLPLMALLLSLCLFVTLPIQSAYSRHIESQADEFALRTTNDPTAGVRAFQKMAVRNLSDPYPPAIVEWFLYSHPAMGERIERARQYAAKAASSSK